MTKCNEKSMKCSNNVGKAIKLTRLDLQLTQKELAAAAGISVYTLRKWEIGQRMPNDFIIVMKLCNALHIEPAILLGVMIDDIDITKEDAINKLDSFIARFYGLNMTIPTPE